MSLQDNERFRLTISSDLLLCNFHLFLPTVYAFFVNYKMIKSSSQSGGLNRFMASFLHFPSTHYPQILDISISIINILPFADALGDHGEYHGSRIWNLSNI